jgi:hypothetical protein
MTKKMVLEYLSGLMVLPSLDNGKMILLKGMEYIEIVKD